MNTLRKLYLLIGLVLSLYLVTWLTTVPVTSSGSPFFTERLTDPNLAQGGAGNGEVTGITGANTAYVTWSEELSGGTYGGFYRQLPFGTTTQIPGVVRHQFQSFAPDIHLPPDGSPPYLTVFQDNGPEEIDLYLWRAGWTGLTHLTDPDNSSFDAWMVSVHFDTSHQPHVFWVEDNDGLFEQDVYYWNETANTTTILSDPALFGNVIPLHTAASGDVMHAIWRDFTGADFVLYHWDSATAVSHRISVLDAMVWDPLRLVIDGAGAPHVFWAQAVPGGFCHYHWTSGLPEGENLSPHTDVCDGAQPNPFFADVDASGQVHFFWIGGEIGNADNDSIYVWRSSTGLVTAYDLNLPSDNIEPLLAPDGTMYAVWDSGDDDNAYYWHSGATQADNISVPGSGSMIGDITSLVDTASTLHLIWRENSAANDPTLYYYNNVLDNTFSLTDPAAVNGFVSNLQMALDSAGVAHITWTDTSVSTSQENLYYWNSQDQMLTTLVADTGNKDDILVRWTSLGDPFVSWNEPVIDEGSDLFLWTPATGPINVSLAGETAGDVDSAWPLFELAQDGNPFLVWYEATGTAAGEDVFGTYIPFLLDKKVYLPTILAD